MSHRILLVDDEVDILEFVRYTLVREGYEVFTAENGAEALKAAADCRPHLILLDMMMPVMDGAQTCRAIRRNPVLKDTMVVFLSALGEEGQQLAGFDVGADDYLTKPIKMKLLVRRVQAILIPGRAEGPTWESAGRVVRLRPLIGLPRRHAPRNDGRGGAGDRIRLSGRSDFEL